MHEHCREVRGGGTPRAAMIHALTALIIVSHYAMLDNMAFKRYSAHREFIPQLTPGREEENRSDKDKSEVRKSMSV